jgi:hypothetical protein
VVRLPKLLAEDLIHGDSPRLEHTPADGTSIEHLTQAELPLPQRERGDA